MRKFFRELSLPRKLILIGIIPSIFLSYIAFELYAEKSDRVRLLRLYTQRINQSASLSRLIDALQNERKLSFDFSISKQLGKGLQAQRKKTDSLVSTLNTGTDLSLYKFEEYTFIAGLGGIRRNIDRSGAEPQQIMDTYTTMIFRLNTLNSSFPATQIYLRPVAKDLAAQRLLTEMLTYLGIIRSNIFNVLHTRQYMIETLAGSAGTYRVYRSYEKEFSLKAPPEVLKMYEHTRATSGLRPTIDYIDTVFARFSFDNSYDAEGWWQVSNDGINSLRNLQQEIWNRTAAKIAGILDQENRSRNQTLVFLILALVVVVVLVSYILHIISSMLRELKEAAGKIAKGDPDVTIDIHSNDAIGSLAESVKLMERQVRERTTALQDSNARLESSNKELEQFAYIASHDLQEPIRKIRTFADQLMVNNQQQLDETGRRYLGKIISSAERMKTIISDLLQYSQINRIEANLETIDLNEVVANVQTDLELMIGQKNGRLSIDKLPTIEAIPVQMNQLFYNLLNNALKFSRDDQPPVVKVGTCPPEKEMLTLVPGADEPGNYVQLFFEDNGIGFPQEFAEKVFVMFHRLGTERSGTGIGLALCKKIVENHHGQIRVQSTPGQGTRFDIVLPKTQPVN